MATNIRPFALTDTEYAAVVAIHNAAEPEYTDTVEEWQHYDAMRDPKGKFQRFVAEVDDQIVGFANYFQPTWSFHPHKYWFSTTVHPEYQGQGVGKALYNHLLEEVLSFEPVLLRVRTREDKARSVRFIRDRGFQEDMREWESRLDVAAFDLAPYADYDQRLSDHGITLKTLRELESDPERNRKLYELDIEVAQDVPSPDPFTALEFERWMENVFHNPNLLPDAFLIALDGDEYVGVSTLWTSKASKDLYNGLTGVKRSHRRKSIALAMKLRNIEWCKANDYPVIKTWNESNNRAMLSINEQLGFVKQPAWVNYFKRLREEA